jgi:hypothetical protein
LLLHKRRGEQAGGVFIFFGSHGLEKKTLPFLALFVSSWRTHELGPTIVFFCGYLVSAWTLADGCRWCLDQLE